MDNIESYLKRRGFKFYDDEAVDYWHKDGILVYREDDCWSCQVSSIFDINVGVSDITDVDSVKKAISVMKKLIAKKQHLKDKYRNEWKKYVNKIIGNDEKA